MSDTVRLKSLPIEELRFENRFTSQLPGDRETHNACRQVKQACFSRVRPMQFAKPQLVAISREVADLLNLDTESIDPGHFAEIFAGNRLLSGMDPFAMCYGGHQFGNWAGQLGDGRAINLGEIVNQRGQYWTLQLKGSGPTPYSRGADGLAVLRSSVREFLCSEAMHHLGVPTTRALSLVLTGEQVTRDMFYDGRPEPEPGAVVCRVSPSFVRFGNFEILAARGDIENLRKLVDYTICHDFPHLGPPTPETYAAFFAEVCQRTAEMIVHWMRVGFVHGVMNTDNMSILGLTIDYGPYGWLEDYDPNWTPNTTDAAGRRYRFGNQPQIAAWNLVQLANALAPLFDDIQPLQSAIDSYSTTFRIGWQAMMAAKLGLNQFSSETDEDLVNDLLTILASVETDMTIFFRRLAWIRCSVSSSLRSENSEDQLAPLMDAYYAPEQLTPEVRQRITEWLDRYQQRVQQDGTPDLERRVRMDAVNPKYVLRNYLAQLAIDKASAGDFSLVSELLDVLRTPYAEQPGREEYAEKRPEWARHRPGCSMLSCSS